MRQYLKNARIKQGYTQTDVANHLGISQNYYCDIENMVRQKELKVTIMDKLSELLNISIDTIILEERKIQKEVNGDN